MYIIGKITAVVEATTKQLEHRLVEIVTELQEASMKYRTHRRAELEQEYIHIKFELSEREKEFAVLQSMENQFAKDPADA